MTWIMQIIHSKGLISRNSKIEWPPAGQNKSEESTLVSVPVRTVAGVTTITADPSCKEQNNAGFGGIFLKA